MNQLAQICNPALPIFGGCGGGGTGETGGLLAQFIASLWITLITLGGLAVLVFLLLGGVGWLTSGGDKAKVEAARDRIVNALVGMTILFASIAFVSFIGPALGFDLLNPIFPNNLGGT
jgi:hypothetical protein